MRHGILFVLAVTLCAGFGPHLAHAGHAEGSGSSAEPQYLLFQLFTAGPGFTTERRGQVISKLPREGFLDRAAGRIVDHIGQRGDKSHRLGVSVGPLALDHTDDQLVALVDRTFDIAEKHDIAVALHIDDSKFWTNRRDLWKDRKNVEWLDWNGTPNSGQFLHWGDPWKLAPQACFNSPALLAEASRIAEKVIGPAIVRRLDALKSRGEEDLFAGVMVGWETAIGQDYETRRDLGYCALTNLGYSKSNPPPDQDAALEGVVRTWIEMWSKSLAKAGVPENRLYSHIAFSPRDNFDEASAAPGKTYSRSVLYSPAPVAFGNPHRPAFSTYPNASILGDIYKALDDHGRPAWGSAEGTNVDIHSGRPTIPERGMESYLASMFNHGATMTNIFGWDIGNRGNPFRTATERAEAVTAYRKFLNGKALTEKPLKASAAPDLSSLQARMRALPQKIQGYARAGGNMQDMEPRVQRLQSFMERGELDKMEKELNQIESIIESH